MVDKRRYESKEMYDKIVFDKPVEQPEDAKEQPNPIQNTRCVYQQQKAHEKSKILSVHVLAKGMVVTGGADGKLKFWDPMGLQVLAMISEEQPIQNIISFG